MRAALVAIAILVAACGPKPAPNGTVTTHATADAGATPDAAAGDSSKDPLAAAVERIVTLYEAIATLPPAGSCRDAATSIDQWTGERTAALAQVRDAAQGSQATLVDGLFHDASPRLSAAMKAVDALATRCASEPALSAALTRLSTEVER